MIRTGTLIVVGDNSRLDDGTLLARCDDANPFRSATDFLANRGFKTGDRIRATGTDDAIGGVAVFCIVDAEPVDVTSLLAMAPSAEPETPRGTSKPASKRAAKAMKSGKKRP